MARTSQMLKDIEESPDGPGIAAIFDFDGTLTSEKSLHEHLHDQLAMAGLSQADSPV